jgi:hypothetical protein
MKPNSKDNTLYDSIYILVGKLEGLEVGVLFSFGGTGG